LRVGHDPLGCLVKAEQNVHRDCTGDQRIGIKRPLAIKIVRQKF